MISLGKNRVFDAGEMESLNRSAAVMISVGINVCEKWDETVSNLWEPYYRIPSEIRSSALCAALEAVRRPLCKDEYEELKEQVSHTLEKLSSNIPACDADAAEVLETVQMETENSRKMMQELMGYIELANTNISYKDYSGKLSEQSASWNTGDFDMEEQMTRASTLIKGLPEYAQYNGDPVNMGTGNFIYRYEDFFIKGAIPLNFIRFYNALDKEKGALGRGWKHNWERKLLIKQEYIIIFHEDGREEKFSAEDDINYRSCQDNNLHLCKFGKYYVYQEQQGNFLFFDDRGRFLRMKSSGGGATLLYENGILTKIVSDTGEFLRLSYNAKNFLQSVEDHTGRAVLFSYEGKKLSSVTDAQGNIFQYSYGKNGRIDQLVDKRGIVILKNNYDEYRRIRQQEFPDGGILKFTYFDQMNRVCLTQQNGNQITYIHDNKFRNIKTCYEDGEESYYYDESDHCTSFKDKKGGITSYAYDKAGRLIKITDALGNQTKSAYDSNGRLKCLMSPNGGQNRWEYDENGRLTAEINSLGYRTELKYAGKKRKPEAIVLAEGSILKLNYDERGNILSIIFPDKTFSEYQYDALNRVIQTKDGNGNSTRFFYDAMDRIVKVIRADGAERHYRYNQMGEAVEIRDFDGYLTEWKYNAVNRPESCTDKCGRTKRMEYDLMWNLVKVTDPEGAETRYVYDKLNRLESVTERNGQTVQFSYDRNGNCTEIAYPDGTQRCYEYDALNRRITEIDENGQITRTFYDSLGNIVRILDAAGGMKEWEYNLAGQLVKERDVAGNIINYSYTALGKVESITFSSGKVIRYIYGAGGQLLKTDNGDDTFEAYCYDKAGNIIERTYQDGNKITYIYDCLNRVTEINVNGIRDKSYTYDAIGNVISMTDAMGNVTSYDYTPEGKLLGVTDPFGNRVMYAYNKCDELTAFCQLNKKEAESIEMDVDWLEIVRLNRENNPLHLTVFERNKAGLIETVTDALGKKERFEYDIMGRIAAKTDKEGRRTEWLYNPGGRIRELRYPDKKSVIFTYDTLYNLKCIRDWLGETAFECDAAGRITKVTDYAGNKVSYGWNPDGTRQWMRYPNGKKVNYEYDSSARLTGIMGDSFHVEYCYDEMGRLAACRRANGVDTLYGYDQSGRLSQMLHQDEAGILDAFFYLYDVLGNRIAATRQCRDNTYNYSYNYIYDALGHLTGIKEKGTLLRSYEYDGYGNRVKLTEYDNRKEGKGADFVNGLHSVTYTCNLLNQVVERNGLLYSYGENGGLKEILKESKNGFRFVYDSLNNLTAFYQDGLLCQKNAYNGLGCRTEMRTLEDTVLYCLDYADEFRRIITESGAQTRNYLWYGDQLLGMPDENSYVLTDALHTPVRVLDRDGQTLNLYQYDEFGQVRKAEENFALPFGYTGYLKEKRENLYFANAREYNGRDGSFLTKDLYHYIDYKNPATANLYQYVQGNPLRYVDYGGHESIEEKKYYREVSGILKEAAAETFKKEINHFIFANKVIDEFIATDLPGKDESIYKTVEKYFGSQGIEWWTLLEQNYPEALERVTTEIFFAQKVISAWLEGFIPQKVNNFLFLSSFETLGQVYHTISDQQIKDNAEENRKILCGNNEILQGGYIENQIEWKNVKLGTGEFQSMSHSGCEIIAVYNARKALGEAVDGETMVNLISVFETDGTVLNGEWGTSPYALWEYFKDEGYEVRMSISKDEQQINEIGEKSDTIIATVYNDKYNIMEQVHTVCITKDEFGKYAVHNAYEIGDGGQYVAKDMNGKGYDTLQDAISDMKPYVDVISIIGIDKQTSANVSE